jgi:hypothetical protein
MSDGSPKLIPIDEQPDHQIVHAFSLGKADCTTYQPLDSRAQVDVFAPDFSVVLFRLNFMLASEEHPMKTHTNQRLSNLLSPTAIPCGATNQGTPHGSWGADAFGVA